MITLTRVEELRSWCEDARRSGRRVALVPTMGFFHEGHRSLMRAARAANDAVIVSIFVNPLQFGPSEDLDAYPRDADGDRAVAEAESVDVLFAPSVDEMYPRPPLTTVHVAELTDGLCGATRPTHFDGVATVVTKLFSIVGPARAYFGRKDAQQLAAVRRFVADLNLPVEVVGCPLVRERDGVAMSSRNAYLSADQRAAATVLVRALERVGTAVEAGERDAGVLRRLVVAEVDAEPLATLDYADVVDGLDLTPVERLGDGGDVLVAVAARIGKTRLIDNTTITIDGTGAHVDLGTRPVVDASGIDPARR
jgi:pantoate--beta-alanine ligase